MAERLQATDFGARLTDLSREVAGRPREEQITAKLTFIMTDPEVASELGSYVRQLIVPGMVAQHVITAEQGRQITDTAAATVSSLLTPEQRAEAVKSAERR